MCPLALDICMLEKYPQVLLWVYGLDAQSQGHLSKRPMMMGMTFGVNQKQLMWLKSELEGYYISVFVDFDLTRSSRQVLLVDSLLIGNGGLVVCLVK
jgi:hypothetical protein